MEEGRGTLSLFSLPLELQRLIVTRLIKHDLTVCVRVCKAWHDRFIDDIWHTVDCSPGSDFHRFDASVFNQLSSLRTFKVSNASNSHDLSSASGETTPLSTESSAVLFTRQIHRIRVLRLRFFSLHDLFYEPPSTIDNDHSDEAAVGDGPSSLSVGLPDLSLEELCIDFFDNPFLRTSSRSPIAPASRSIRPLLQMLERSKSLQKLSINLWGLQTQGDDLSRLFAALPSTLKELTLEFNPSNTVDGQLQVLPTLQTFGALKALRIRDHSTDLHFSLTMNLLERCPVLEELDAVFDDQYAPNPLSDSHLARILSVGSKNLRVPECSHLPSEFIQKLLCSAPCLKRLDLIAESFSLQNKVVLMASDIVDSSEDWVCLQLETFKCKIGGIPRPDVRARTNGRPLEGILNDPSRYTIYESRAIQRKVLAQFGRLTMLREITLGLSNLLIESGNHGLFWDEQETEGEYYQDYDFQRDRQYECLSLSLEDGLDQLKDLKQMRRLRADRMVVHLGDAREKEWIKENWPNYRKEFKDTFWTSRGHHIPLTDGMEPENFGEGMWTYDWW